jgi:transposase
MGKDKSEGKPKHPGGRPSGYKPEWCSILPDMFREGQSVVEVATELGISKSAYYLYESAYPEFMDASTRGKQISQAWWEKQGRTNLFDTSEYDGDTKQSSTRKFNNALWAKNVACRFRGDWTDKQEIEISDLTIKHTFDPEGL